MRPCSWQFCTDSKNCSLAPVISKYSTTTEHIRDAQPTDTFSQTSISSGLPEERSCFRFAFLLLRRTVLQPQHPPHTITPLALCKAKDAIYCLEETNEIYPSLGTIRPGCSSHGAHCPSCKDRDVFVWASVPCATL